MRFQRFHRRLFTQSTFFHTARRVPLAKCTTLEALFDAHDTMVSAAKFSCYPCGYSPLLIDPGAVSMLIVPCARAQVFYGHKTIRAGERYAGALSAEQMPSPFDARPTLLMCTMLRFQCTR